MKPATKKNTPIAISANSDTPNKYAGTTIIDAAIVPVFSLAEKESSPYFSDTAPQPLQTVAYEAISVLHHGHCLVDIV
jgi:hypothetical protein